MFDMMKMLGKLNEVKAKMAEINAKAEQMTHTAESGAGLVKATVSGKRKLITLEIDPSLLGAQDSQILSDLIVAATNKALKEVEEMVKEEVKKSTEGLLPNIPGLDLSSLGLG